MNTHMHVERTVAVGQPLLFAGQECPGAAVEERAAAGGGRCSDSMRCMSEAMYL